MVISAGICVSPLSGFRPRMIGKHPRDVIQAGSHQPSVGVRPSWASFEVLPLLLFFRHRLGDVRLVVVAVGGVEVAAAGGSVGEIEVSAAGGAVVASTA